MAKRVLGPDQPSSPSLLQALETIKNTEFGAKEINLSEFPRLETKETTPKRSKRYQDKSFDETPNGKRRKVENEYLNGESEPNDGKEINNGDVHEDFLQVVATKPKDYKRRVRRSNVDRTEELRARKEMQMKCLQRFMEISLKYSQFLENKIVGPNTSGTATKTAVSIKGRNDVMEKLKYFEGELRPYQVEGVTWLALLFENAVNGILADEMGLGKTIQIIAFFCHLYERKVSGPFLIVAPLSTIGNWESEFKKFAPKIPVVRFHGNAYERRQLMDQVKRTYRLEQHAVKPVVICSFQLPIVEDQFLQSFTWQYIVVDEGQRIKNPDTKLSRELRALRSVNRTLLTGTPLQNDIRELWALFNFLMPEVFSDIEAFSSLLDLSDIQDKGKLLENEAQNKIISTIHRVLAPFMLRREKKFVLDDIVPKKEVIIYCSLTELQKYLYKAVLQKDLKKLNMQENVQDAEKRVRRKFDQYNAGKKDVDRKARRELKPNKENVSVNCPDSPYMINLTMQSPLSMLIKAVNHPYLIWSPLVPNTKTKQLLVDEDLIKHSGKLLVLDAMLRKLKAQGHKVLIFSTLVMFLDMIEELMLMRGYQYRRLDGMYNLNDRTQNINEFTNDDNVFVFLLSTRAGGLGLNLTSADTVIFMDRDWNPMADMQAQDRCHRIGQTKPVMIYSLIVKGTVDELILTRSDMKKRLEKVVLKEGMFKTMHKNFGDDELKELETLLNNEEKSEKIHANGLVYTDKELDQILDRSELIEQMKNKSTSKS